MKLNKLRTIASLFTIAAVAGVVALAIPANGAGTTDNRFITVTGVGTISVVPDAVRFNATVSTVETATSLSFDERRRTQCISLASQGEKDVGSNVEQEYFLRKRSDTSKHVCFSRSPPRHVEEFEDLHLKNQLLRSFSYSTPSTGGGS